MAGPYLSVKELESAPTGIDWTTVPVKGATTPQQQAEIRRIIRRATNRVNNYCNQKLWATRDTTAPIEVPSRFAVVRNGVLTVYTTGSPIISVESVQFSADGTAYAVVQGTPIFRSGPDLIPDFFRINLNSATSFPYSGWDGWLEVTYINGYPNGTLAANALAGDVSVQIDDPMGIAVGDVMTIYDDEFQEDVQIAAAYVKGSATLPLIAPLAYAHLAGTAISELPDDIKDATILFAVDITRQRGRDTASIGGGGTVRMQKAGSGPSTAVDEAKELLNKYRRIL